MKRSKPPLRKDFRDAEDSSTPKGGHINRLDLTELERNCDRLADSFAQASPWEHVIIDAFLPPTLAVSAANAFPILDGTRMRLARYLGARAHGSNHEMSSNVADLLMDLTSDRFVRLLINIARISALEADHELSEPFHQGAYGSFLPVHSDRNTHPSDASRFRRINVLIYLNAHWERSWRGDLELWDREATNCLHRIQPNFNRCVIMRVDDTAFHGYGPLRMPKNVTRKALAVSYYAKQPATNQLQSPHKTLLPLLPGQTIAARVRERIRRSLLHRLETRLL